MKIARLKTGFDSVSDAAFEIKASHINVSMEGNENFPTPTPQLPDVKGALLAYHEARVAAKDKSKNAIAAKKEARNILTALLIQLANYVMTTANGDRKQIRHQPCLHFIICRKRDHLKKLLPENFSCNGCFAKFGRTLFRGFGLPDAAWHRTRIVFVTAFIKHYVLDPSGDLQINL